MNKKESEQLTNDMLVADTLLRLKTMESLLVSKGIFTKEEFLEEMSVIARQIAKTILQNANIQGDIEDLVKSLQLDVPPKDRN